MVKKAPAVKKPGPDSSKQLVDAIATVKHLQDFIQEHGGLNQAVEAVNRVYQLIELTGGVDELKQALTIVGGEGQPEAAPSQG
ncbi:MAG: hypothetical protein ABFD16_21395 [Thermoguttaceae bacterium]|jgi:hypothetical protein